MKINILFLFITLFLPFFATAQNNEGIIQFEEKVNVHRSLPPDAEGVLICRASAEDAAKTNRGAGLPRFAQSWPSARSASVRLAAAKTVTGSWARAGLAAMASPPRAASNGRRCIRLRAVALSPDNDIDRRR